MQIWKEMKYRKGKSPYDKTGLNQDCKDSCKTLRKNQRNISIFLTTRKGGVWCCDI